MELVKRSAEMGYSVAQGYMAMYYEPPAAIWNDVYWVDEMDSIRLKWAKLAAAQGDRNGLFVLGSNTRDKSLLLRAAELGQSKAQNLYSYSIEYESYEWFDWKMKSAIGGNPLATEYFRHLPSLAVTYTPKFFALGKLLLPDDRKLHTIIYPAYRKNLSIFTKSCIDVYTWNCSETKEAVRWWTLVGLRLGICEDMWVKWCGKQGVKFYIKSKYGGRGVVHHYRQVLCE